MGRAASPFCIRMTSSDETTSRASGWLAGKIPIVAEAAYSVTDTTIDPQLPG